MSATATTLALTAVVLASNGSCSSEPVPVWFAYMMAGLAVLAVAVVVWVVYETWKVTR